MYMILQDTAVGSCIWWDLSQDIHVQATSLQLPMRRCVSPLFPSKLAEPVHLHGTLVFKPIRSTSCILTSKVPLALILP